MRLVCMGTPAFACVQFDALREAGHTISAMYAQPDKPVGRHMTLTPPPTKSYAQKHGIPVEQPQTLRGEAVLAGLAAYEPEAVVVAAYGKILPPAMLALPKFGCINVHASLLPRYRGAAPIQRAVLAGESETGVTIMRMDEGLDTGDVYAAQSCPIGADDTSGAMFEKLAALGAPLLVRTLDAIARGAIEARKQDETLATAAPPLRKAEGEIDFTRGAGQIHNHIRGMQPWPGAFARLRGKRVKILQSRLLRETIDAPPGTLRFEAGILKAVCGDGGVIEFVVVQPEGKAAMPAAAFANGRQL
jgi:methionyl-tRNA formyltransferase